MNNQDQAYLAGLRETSVNALLESLRGATEIAILDAPNQRNVGDSLIWAGEMAYFERLGLRIRYVADLWSYDPAVVRRLLPSDGVVLLHGGGNFGDLWIGHQLFREQVAKDLPDRRIVQLPQSVFFGDPSRAKSANDLLSRHPDFHVLLRDQLSMERSDDWLPDLQRTYCPDMALGWDPPTSFEWTPEGRRITAIARADKEASSGLDRVTSDWIPGARTEVADWEPAGRSGRAWARARKAAKLQRGYVKVRRTVHGLPAGLPDRISHRIVNRLNTSNIAGAIELYRPARAIVVDRLHAHILAALLGIPHVVLDNNYRKVSAIFEDYSGGFSTASYATDLAEARQLLVEAIQAP